MKYLYTFNYLKNTKLVLNFKFLPLRSVHEVVNEKDNDDDEPKYSEEFKEKLSQDEIIKLCDVSRLPERYRGVRKGSPPKIEFEWQKGIKYQRKLFGKYGEKSKVDPRICWPSKTELQDMIEYQQEFETPLDEALKQLEEKKQKEKQAALERRKNIEENLAKMDDMIDEHWENEKRKVEDQEKRAKKRDDVLEEARRYYGHHIKSYSPEFLDLLAQKEAEELKANKKRKKEDRLARLAAKLAGKEA